MVNLKIKNLSNLKLCSTWIVQKCEIVEIVVLETSKSKVKHTQALFLNHSHFPLFLQDFERKGEGGSDAVKFRTYLSSGIIRTFFFWGGGWSRYLNFRRRKYVLFSELLQKKSRGNYVFGGSAIVPTIFHIVLLKKYPIKSFDLNYLFIPSYKQIN